MSFLTYKSTRPFAKAIKEAASIRRMPPWHADPHFGKFSNDKSMTQADINTLVAWADSGAKEGNPKDATQPVRFGEQSWEEMMIGFFDVSVPPGTTERDLLQPKRKPAGD